MDTDGVITKPRGTALPQFSLNHPLTDTTLKPQWKFMDGVDDLPIKAGANGLSVKGKGNSVGNSAPLVCVSSGHSYIAEVELEIEAEATAGLLLFYNNSYFSGILADKQDILSLAVSY